MKSVIVPDYALILSSCAPETTARPAAGHEATLRKLETESHIPAGAERFSIAPTCDGYPDVDTYRDFEFYLLEK